MELMFPPKQPRTAHHRTPGGARSLITVWAVLAAQAAAAAAARSAVREAAAAAQAAVRVADAAEADEVSAASVVVCAAPRRATPLLGPANPFD